MPRYWKAATSCPSPTRSRNSPASFANASTLPQSRIEVAENGRRVSCVGLASRNLQFAINSDRLPQDEPHHFSHLALLPCRIILPHVHNGFRNSLPSTPFHPKGMLGRLFSLRTEPAA